MSKLSGKLKEEFHALLPPTIFFFVALHLVAFVRALMLTGTGVAVGTSLSITIAALIIAKAVLVADLMPLINRFSHKPLAYSVAWKTAIYFVVASLVHYLERLVDFWRQAGGLVAANEKMLAEMVWPHFWAIQIFVLVLIFLYCTLREFSRALGQERVREIFFGPTKRAAAVR